MVPPAAKSLDALIAAAGIDPEAGVQIAAAPHLRALDPTRPALLLLDEATALRADTFVQYPPETEVTALRAKGGAAPQSERLPLRELFEKNAAAPEKLVALLLPGVAAEEARFDFRGLRGVIARLRDPHGGCPWDLAQDHQSLRPHLLEETYEVLAALDHDDPAALREELGDLLMQVVLHAQIAAQTGEFDIDDVCEGIRAKLVRRHPHVFADADLRTADAVVDHWDRFKAAERDAAASALDGVPPTLPALARAQALAGRAARRGFAWPDDGALLDTLVEAVRDLRAADPAQAGEEFGDLLFVLAEFARRRRIEAEDALRTAASKFERRFRALEASLVAARLELRQLDQETLRQHWEAAQGAEGQAEPGGAAGAPS